MKIKNGRLVHRVKAIIWLILSFITILLILFMLTATIGKNFVEANTQIAKIFSIANDVRLITGTSLSVLLTLILLPDWEFIWNRIVKRKKIVKKQLYREN